MKSLNESYWQKSASIKKFPNANIDKSKFDLLIIGAGITGLTTAYLLRNSGYHIGIIDGTSIGYGTTGYSTAKLTVQHGARYHSLIDSFGAEEASQYLKANEQGLELVRSIINTNSISCEYRDQDAYIYTVSEDEASTIRKECEAYKKLNIDGFYTENTTLPFEVKAAACIRNQGQFNPIKYMHGLCRVLEDSCCRIYENVRAINIETHNGCHNVTTDCGTISAGKIVIASHYPFDNDLGMFFLRLYQEKSYVLAAETDEEAFDGMYITLREPVHSLRYHRTPNGNILLLGGGNHPVGVKDDENQSFIELEKFLFRYFPHSKIIGRWSAQDCMTYDKIPYIGRASSKVDNIYTATGFNKWGMTSSSAAAIILRNKILGIEDDFSQIFDTQRITPVQSAGEFMKAGSHIAMGFAKRLYTGSFDSLCDVNTGEGKVLNINGKKVGVYRDQKNEYHCVSPVCTHLKCALSFNEAEKTWDCPCHGSRFDADGRILEGPAVEPLDKIRIRQDGQK